MKRYNHVGIPKDVEESANGYWVKYEDIQYMVLDHAKELERYNRSEISVGETISKKYEEMLSKQQNIITILSAIVFVFVGIGLFKLLGA